MTELHFIAGFIAGFFAYRALCFGAVVATLIYTELGREAAAGAKPAVESFPFDKGN